MNGVRLTGLLGLASLLATGCASSAAPIEAQLGRLQSEIASLRSQNAALSERVGTLEASRTTPVAPPAEAAAAVAPAAPGRPRLEVVRLTPIESETDAQPPVAVPTEAAAPEAPRTRFRSTPKGIVEEPIDDPRAKPTGRTSSSAGSPGVRASATHSDRAKP